MLDDDRVMMFVHHTTPDSGMAIMLHRIRILIAVALLAATSAFAQLPLTDGSLPSGSMQYTQIVVSTPIPFDSGGRNRVWVYNDLGIGRERTVSHLEPASLQPSVLAQFPLTQVAVQQDSVLTLYARVGQFFRQLGTVTPNTQTAVVVDPYDTRPTEIVYSGRIIDAHRADIRITTTPPYTGTRRGQSTTSYDAAGTLFIPGYQFNNVARLNTMMVTVDTLRNGTQTLVVRTETRRLTFQQVDSPILLLDHSLVIRTVLRGGVVVAPPDTVRTTAYFGRLTTSVDEVHAGPLPTLSPNPITSDHVVVNGVGFAPQSIDLVGIEGGVHTVDTWSIAGALSLRAWIPPVANGAYSLRLHRSDGSVVAIPIIVVR